MVPEKNPKTVDGSSPSAAWSGETGIVNRVYDRISNRLSGFDTGAAVATALALGVSSAGLFATQAAERDAVASHPTVHVAVMGQGTARTDYGYRDVSVEAMAGSKGDFRSVRAEAGSEPSPGAVATGHMLEEMRLHMVNRVVVHAYDPFVKGPSGTTRLDFDGLRDVVPQMARDGVKVAVVPFALSGSQDGREFSRIMKDNGIAVVAPVTDAGIKAAPDIVTVQSYEGRAPASSRANLVAMGTKLSAVGKVAANGAIHASMTPGLSGSAAIGSEIQDRIDRGTQLVAKRQFGLQYHVKSLQATNGVRLATAGTGRTRTADMGLIARASSGMEL